jgi:hypothetical protein
MFDLVCFFFVFLPAVSMVRESKQNVIVKLIINGAIMCLIAGYTIPQILPTSKSANAITTL